MADRDVAKSQSAARITTTSTTPQDAQTVTFTPASASKKYYILASCIADHSVGVSPNAVAVDLYDSTAGSVLQQCERVVKDTTDKANWTFLYEWTSPSTPVSQTFKLRYYNTSTGTAGIQERTLIVLESHASDGSAVTPGNVSTSATAFQDGQTVSLTVGSGGDYLILAGGQMSNTSANDARARLNVDGVSVLPFSPVNVGSNGKQSLSMAYRATLAAGSRDVKLQYCSTAGANVTLYAPCIVAIRVDTLRLFSSDYTAARITTTSTTPQDGASTTITAEPSVDYLVVSSVVIDGNSTTISTNAQMLLDGVAANIQIAELSVSGSNRPYGPYSVAQYAAGSRTFKTQFFSETASITTGAAHRGIYVLDFREAAAGASLTKFDHHYREMRAAA